MCGGTNFQQHLDVTGYAITVQISDTSPFNEHDLSAVLTALCEHTENLWWRISFLDALGDADVEALCTRVERARPQGRWIPTNELMRVASQITQTIEAEMMAFLPSYPRNAVKASPISITDFRDRLAELAIEFIDDGIVDVLTKDPADIERMRAVFGTVTVVDADTYLAL